MIAQLACHTSSDIRGSGVRAVRGKEENDSGFIRSGEISFYVHGYFGWMNVCVPLLGTMRVQCLRGQKKVPDDPLRTGVMDSH